MYFASVERGQLRFTITEHLHPCGWTDFGFTKTRQLFINVPDNSAVSCVLTDVNVHFIKMLIEKQTVLCVACLSTVLFCLFYVKQKQDACPYFYFKHHHLAHLYCSNFSFLAFL